MRLGLQRLINNAACSVSLRKVINQSGQCFLLNQFCRQSSISVTQHLPSGTRAEGYDANDESTKEEAKDESHQDFAHSKENGVTIIRHCGGRNFPLRKEEDGGESSRNASLTAIESLDSQTTEAQWKKRLSSFEHYQRESDPKAVQVDPTLLINDNVHAENWNMWLELIRFRYRHHGPQSMQTLFQEIMRRDMSLPTKGVLGEELWSLLITASHGNSDFLLDVISYSIQVKEATGDVWPALYYNVLIHVFRTDPALAYYMHRRLKNLSPPVLGDYQKLFGQCSRLDRVDVFETLYRDYAVQGMYEIIVPELCRLQKYRDAVKWHDLLFANQDFPSDFDHLHPLLKFLAEIGDDRQMERIAKDLSEACGKAFPTQEVPDATEKFIRKHIPISRAVFNRHLAEIHHLSPRHLSDSFCARLFATRLFSIGTIISGLQMMAVSTIGPLTMRELAMRDTYRIEDFCSHLAQMKDGGMVPDNSVFSTLLHNLALKKEKPLFRSLAECDLHPDAFEDTNLQERLLGQYYERNDRLQFERTLAAITVRCREEDLLKWRLNLTLRCQITLRRTEAVIASLENMKREQVTITTRSSRHLRNRWLSERLPGQGPETTKELSIIINTSLSALRSGRYVPFKSWREIMRRLGMAGRLDEVESLALCLVDLYTNRTGKIPLAKHIAARQKKLSRNKKSQARLSTLFTLAAQHAIIAWGFQQEAKGMPRVYRIKPGLIDPVQYQPPWMWGLMLLKQLQSRGVPIHQSTIARICQIRLRTLFGPGESTRPINRRSQLIKDQRTQGRDRWALKFYIREMEKVWGEDLFRSGQKVLLFRSISGHVHNRDVHK